MKVIRFKNYNTFQLIALYKTQSESFQLSFRQYPVLTLRFWSLQRDLIPKSPLDRTTDPWSMEVRVGIFQSLWAECGFGRQRVHLFSFSSLTTKALSLKCPRMLPTRSHLNYNIQVSQVKITIHVLQVSLFKLLNICYPHFPHQHMKVGDKS